MALFRSDQGIGRGEPAESRLEAPFFAAFMLMSALILLIVHFYVGNNSITLALAVSMIVFGLTILRVDLAVYVIVTAMLLSPEIDFGAVGLGERRLTVRYDDVLVIVTFLGVMVKQAFLGKRHLWLPNPVNPAIVGYFGVCIFSTLLAFKYAVPAYDKAAAPLILLKMAEFYMIFVLVGSAIQSAKQVRNQLTVFFLVSLGVNMYALDARQSLGRVSAPFETGGTEPNTVGGYLVIIICIALGLLIYAPTRRLKAMYGLIVVVAFRPFLLALSRASYIALIAALIALGGFARRPFIIAAVFIVLVLSPYVMPAEVIDRVNYTFQRGSGTPVIIGGADTGIQVDKSTYERIYVWDKVKFNLTVWPIFGGGVGWGMVLDSQYARVLIETGVVGLISFVFLQYRMLRTIRETHRWSRDWVGKGLGLGASAMVVGMIVHSLGTISFLIVRVMEPFWYLMALTVICRTQALDDHWQERRRLERRDSETGAAPRINQEQAA